MPLQIQPGVLDDKMALVYHSGAIELPNNEVQLKADHIDAVKGGSRDLITIYVEVPGQREDVAGLESKILEYVAYLLHPYTSEVWQASGKEWAEFVGEIDQLFPKAARELEMAVRVCDENVKNGAIHVYPEKPNCPGPRGQEYILLNPRARFVRAELGKPSDEPLTLFFINVKTRDWVPEFYRGTGTLDFNNPADIDKINHWRSQVMRRRKCLSIRFDKTGDEMWTVKEQGRLNQLVRAVLEYHKRLGKHVDITFDRIDWDMVRAELESFCYDPQPGSSELAICCDADRAADGWAQRRHLVTERVTFCRTSELIKQRAINTIDTIMETDIDETIEELMEQGETCSVFNLVKLEGDVSDDEEEGDDEDDVAASLEGKKVAAPIITNKVVSCRITKPQTNGKKARGKRAPKAKATGAANSKKTKALTAAAAETSSSSDSQETEPSSADNIAAPASVKKGKGKRKGKGKEVAADADFVMTDSPAADDNYAMDVDEDPAAAIALSKLSNGAGEGVEPSGTPRTPPAKPTRGGLRSARRQK